MRSTRSYKIINRSIGLLVGIMLVMSFGVPIFAQTPPPATPGGIQGSDFTNPITFVPGSGLQISLTNQKEFPGTTLLGIYMNALLQFFLRLAIILGVLMVTIGGFQWMVALGNAGKIEKAKESIHDAVVGLILAATSVLIFSQIDTSFVVLKSPVTNQYAAGPLDCGKWKNSFTCVDPRCGWDPSGTTPAVAGGVSSAGACIECFQKFKQCTDYKTTAAQCEGDPCKVATAKLPCTWLNNTCIGNDQCKSLVDCKGYETIVIAGYTHKTTCDTNKCNLATSCQWSNTYSTCSIKTN